MRKQTLLLAPMLFVSCLFFARVSIKDPIHTTKSIPAIAIEPNWVGLLEAPSEIEVFYAFDTCNDQRKFLLKYFNEMPHAQTIKFKVTLKYAGYVIAEEKTKSLAANQTITGECSSSDANLSIPIPPQWKLGLVTVSAELVEVTQQ